MAKRIKPIWHTTANVGNTSAAQGGVTPKDSRSSKNVVEPSIVERFPKLVGASREGISSGSYIKAFLSYHADKTLLSLPVNVQSIFACDLKFNEPVDEIKRQFDKDGVDLATVLLSRLQTTKNFAEKSILAKMLFYLDKDKFVTEYLIPCLQVKVEVNRQTQALSVISYDTVNLPFAREQAREYKKYIGNELERNNWSFCEQLLQSLNESEMVELFENTDFAIVVNHEAFGDSLANLKNPASIINALLDLAEVNLSDTTNDDKSQATRIHSILLSAAKALRERQVVISNNILQAIYKTTDNKDIQDTALEYMSKDSEFDKFLLDFIKDDSDTSYEARLRRFWAIFDYANSKKAAGAKGLKNFILESEDQFLVNYACYELIQRCGVSGKKAFTSAIQKQVKEEKPSLPLAFLTFMVTKFAKLKPEYGEIFKSLLMLNFSDGAGLKQAYENLRDTQISKLQVNDIGVLVFCSAETETIPPMTDLISVTGLKKLFNWEADDRKINTARNILALIEYALEEEREKTLGLLSAEFITDEDTLTKDILHRIAGIKDK